MVRLLKILSLCIMVVIVANSTCRFVFTTDFSRLDFAFTLVDMLTFCLNFRNYWDFKEMEMEARENINKEIQNSKYIQ